MTSKYMLAFLLLLTFSLSASYSAAQVGFSSSSEEAGILDVRVDGPLSEQAKEALAKLAEPAQLSALYDALAEAKPLSEVCSTSVCPNGGAIAAASAEVAGSLGLQITPTMVVSSKTPSLPDSLSGGENSLIRRVIVLGPGSPITGGVRFPWDEPVAIPITGFPQTTARPIGPSLATSSVIDFSKGSPAASALIQSDLDTLKYADRQFRINRLLSDQDRSNLLALLNRDPHVSAAVKAKSTDGFTFIQFQTSQSGCSAASANWPYRYADVELILNYDRRVRELMRVGPMSRSRVLVVDTGLGRTVAQSDWFEKYLYIDPSELMTAPTIQRALIGGTSCSDGNGDFYSNDVVGSSAGAIHDNKSCLSGNIDYLSIVSPFPKNETSDQEYVPYHGTFVGVLSIGGAYFATSYKDASNFIGLSFFRVTRPPLSNDTSVSNEYGDIGEAFKYSEAINADIINMSLKTEQDSPFEAFGKSGSALLIAAAGNGREDLDKQALYNRPASMDLGDKMIVVGALQNDSKNPWWEESAHGPMKVHIAAPGVSIRSIDSDGHEVCDSGTSAAAPLVTFTAGLLHSVTGASRQLVRSRILGSADHIASLDQYVEDGRALNIPAALDVFVDRIQLENPEELVRGWIDPDGSTGMTQICSGTNDDLEETRGSADLSLIWDWWRGGDNLAFIRHQLGGSGRFEKAKCAPPKGQLSFFDLTTRTSYDLDWNRISRIIPSPFRAVKAVVIKDARSPR